jgi:hypothetical protein
MINPAQQRFSSSHACPGSAAAGLRHHLGFVAAQPCLIRRRKPCDARHLRFAQRDHSAARSAMNLGPALPRTIINNCIAMATKPPGGRAIARQLLASEVSSLIAGGGLIGFIQKIFYFHRS